MIVLGLAVPVEAAPSAAQLSSITAVQWETVLTTVGVGAVLITVAAWITTHASVGRPRALQVVWEGALGTIEDRAVRAPGWVRDRMTALAFTLFWFIVVANSLHLVPGVGLRPPTADLNLTLALALVVVVAVHVTAVQVRGVRGYLEHYLRPWWLVPVKVIEELLKPVTLGLRLFGMAFASALMLLLIGELLPPHFAVLPHALWTLFDLFIGLVQAYVFALLTILYFHAALPAATGLAGPAGRPSQQGGETS